MTAPRPSQTSRPARAPAVAEGRRFGQPPGTLARARLRADAAVRPRPTGSTHAAERPLPSVGAQAERAGDRARPHRLAAAVDVFAGERAGRRRASATAGPRARAQFEHRREARDHAVVGAARAAEALRQRRARSPARRIGVRAPKRRRRRSAARRFARVERRLAARRRQADTRAPATMSIVDGERAISEAHAAASLPRRVRARLRLGGAGRVPHRARRSRRHRRARRRAGRRRRVRLGRRSPRSGSTARFAAFVAFGEAIVAGGAWATFDVGAGAAPLRRRRAPRRRATIAPPPPASSPPPPRSASSASWCSSTTAPSRSTMAAKRNSALTTAMVAVVAVPLAALAWFPLYRLCARGSSPSCRARARSCVLGALVALSALVVVAAVLSVDWRVIDFGPAESLALFFVAAGGAARSCFARRRRAAGAPSSPAAGRSPPSCLVVTWVGFGGNARARRASPAKSRWAKRCCSGSRAASPTAITTATPARLGGGDCNDHDARRSTPAPRRSAATASTKTATAADAPVETARARRETAQSAAAAEAQVEGQPPRHHHRHPARRSRQREDARRTCTSSCKQAVSFSHAYAQAPNTPRSFPSFLTSRFPSEVRWAEADAQLPAACSRPPTTPPSSRRSRRPASTTVGVFSHFYLSQGDGHHRRLRRVAQRRRAHAARLEHRLGGAAHRAARRVGSCAASPRRRCSCVLWTHFFEPHSRYMEHDEFPAHDGGLKGLEEKYDGEVSFVDKLHRRGARRARGERASPRTPRW